MIVVRKPVGVTCSACVKAGRPRSASVMLRISLSRLEEGLGHEGFECNVCHTRVKYVPPEIR